MPEGPEIRLAADEIANALVGHPTQEICFAFDHLKTHEALLTGETITAVETHGKAMLTRFAHGWNIYSHNQLYGIWMVRPAYDFPATTRQLRLAIHNHSHSALLYSASDIEVLHNDDLADHPFLSRIGPDLLDPTLTAEAVAARLLSPKFRRRKLTTLFLDQHFLAGLGNYLRSEVLFVARVPPAYRPVDCSDAQIAALAEATITLTRQSYATRGITNDLALVKELRQQGWTHRRYRWWIFERDGEPCHRCGGLIVKDEIGGRRIYYCEGCQKA